MRTCICIRNKYFKLKNKNFYFLKKFINNYNYYHTKQPNNQNLILPIFLIKFLKDYIVIAL